MSFSLSSALILSGAHAATHAGRRETDRERQTEKYREKERAPELERDRLTFILTDRRTQREILPKATNAARINQNRVFALPSLIWQITQDANERRRLYITH